MRISCDTGGTFTDVIVEAGAGEWRLFKAPSNPADPVAGILAALDVAAAGMTLSRTKLLSQTTVFVHGTTRALNAIVTKATAKTALLVTEGHADLLWLREGGRADPFDRRPYPPPFIPKSLTFEVHERIWADGRIISPLDEDRARQLLKGLADRAVEAIAVCLLWSFVNAEHELRLEALIQEILPNIPYTLSHRLNPVPREFRRASSCSIDASLKPEIQTYIGSLDTCLREEGFAGSLLIMTSSGGMLDAVSVSQSPIHVLNSGPAMAPATGWACALAEGHDTTAIVADSGGTTYDVSVVRSGMIQMTHDYCIGSPSDGLLTGFPSVDIRSVGAGGGSIASIDAFGLMTVGPESAGAVPGPACYRRGGDRPTVTDAALVLGLLDPASFLAGAMPLSCEASIRAIDKHVASKVGLDVYEAAIGIMRVTTENMAQAVLDITVNQGIDPSKAVLVGGGGSAGFNSVQIGERIGCPTVIFPGFGAAISAAGGMLSDVCVDERSFHFQSTRNFDAQTCANMLMDLQRRALGVRYNQNQSADLFYFFQGKYEGQVWDLEVPFRFSDAQTLDGEELRELFHQQHERHYTFRDTQSAVDIMSWRIRAAWKVATSGLQASSENSSEMTKTKRAVYFSGDGWRDVGVVSLDRVAQTAQSGPAIVEARYTSIFVGANMRFHRGLTGSLVVKISA